MQAPVDPRDAEIAALRAETKRLRADVQELRLASQADQNETPAGPVPKQKGGRRRAAGQAKKAQVRAEQTRALIDEVLSSPSPEGLLAADSDPSAYNHVSGDTTWAKFQAAAKQTLRSVDKSDAQLKRAETKSKRLARDLENEQSKARSVNAVIDAYQVWLWVQWAAEVWARCGWSEWME